ncbi:MAG: CRISPR-associated protein Cas4, partial [Candidatus Nezhaarchaeales archaeon]
VLHLRERITEAMQYGKEQHEDPPLTPLIPKLKPIQIMRNVELTSHKLKLTGKIDTIMVTRHGEYIPIEVKWSEPKHPGKPRRQHKAQLTAYALLIEENFKTTVKRAIIYYSRSRQLMEIPLTSQDKQQIKQYIQQIYKIIQKEETPNIKQNPKQCQDCGYKLYCLS